jgi:predicted nucleotidyltransferase
METKEKIMEVIFAEPEKWIHIRELARKSKTSPNTAKTYVAEEKKKGILKTKKEGNMVLCKANMESENYLIKKRLSNISKIFDSGAIDYLDNYYDHPKAIILFGSYSRGEDISTSDLDIAIITQNKKRPDLSRYEKILKRKIELSLLTNKEISKEFFNNLINGFVLKGFFKYEGF